MCCVFRGEAAAGRVPPLKICPSASLNRRCGHRFATALAELVSAEFLIHPDIGRTLPDSFQSSITTSTASILRESWQTHSPTSRRGRSTLTLGASQPESGRAPMGGVSTASSPRLWAVMPGVRGKLRPDLSIVPSSTAAEERATSTRRAQERAIESHASRSSASKKESI